MQEYAASVQTLRATVPALAAELAGFHTLENVLRWMEKKGLSLAGLDIVFQDEYHHDALIPLANGRWLVFGIT
jgi:hypothetical protein